MLCPICQEELDKTIFYGVEIDHCPKCFGLWFEQDELRLAKDIKDETLSWIDIDLWRDRRKFMIARDKKLCPFCRLPLYEVNYWNSDIKVDFCSLCFGTWLDRGEFKKVIKYLRSREDYEVFNNFSKNLIMQFWEIFIGPKTLREEISDFLTVLKILLYKFSVQHPNLENVISNLPK